MARVRFMHALVAAAVVVGGACGDDDEPEAADTSDTTAPPAEETDGDAGDGETCTADRVGGTVTIAAAAVGVSLDPYTSSGGAASSVLETLPIYDSLLRFDSATNEFVGQLAEGIEPNADASEWTLTLRDGVEFGNGDPLDAEAVMASIERHIDPDGESRMKPAGAFIESMEVVDPLTLKFVLTQPWGTFPLHLAAGGGSTGALGMIQNVRVIDEIGADAFGANPEGGGAGPYEVAEWTPPERVVLRAKEDWWGGPVCIEELVFLGLADGTARFDAMRTGELDIAVLNRDPAIAAEAAELYEHVENINVAGNQIEFNFTDPELADPRVREAMALAVDTDVIDERAFGGASIPWNGLISEESQLLEPTDGPEVDQARAAELVEELKAEGMALQFQLVHSNLPAVIEAGLATEALLESVGFEIEPIALETSPLQVRVYRERDFDLFIGGQLAEEASLYPALYRFHSANPANPYGLASPTVDAALDGLRTAQSTDDLQAAIEDVQTVWNEEVPSIVMGSERHGLFWNERVHGLYFTRGITPYFDQAYVED